MHKTFWRHSWRDVGGAAASRTILWLQGSSPGHTDAAGVSPPTNVPASASATRDSSSMDADAVRAFLRNLRLRTHDGLLSASTHARTSQGLQQAGLSNHQLARAHSFDASEVDASRNRTEHLEQRVQIRFNDAAKKWIVSIDDVDPLPLFRRQGREHQSIFVWT